MNDLERAEVLADAANNVAFAWHVAFTLMALYFAFWFIARRRHLKSKDKPMDFALNSITFDPQWSGE